MPHIFKQCGQHPNFINGILIAQGFIIKLFELIDNFPKSVEALH